MAVLGDENSWWRPTEYSYSRWGCELSLQFPVVKLLDYQERWQILERDSNPFAVIVMAHLKTKETHARPQERLQQKLSLVRGLYERGYSREQVLQLFRLIDWMMDLPQELAARFENELSRYEEERRMPYITSIERIGMLKATRESVIEVLETRFEEVPSSLSDRLNNIYNLELLKQLLKRTITISSLEEFEQLLAQSEPGS